MCLETFNASKINYQPIHSLPAMRGCSQDTRGIYIYIYIGIAKEIIIAYEGIDNSYFLLRFLTRMNNLSR